jgi:hypothetical protein
VFVHRPFVGIVGRLATPALPHRHSRTDRCRPTTCLP